MTTADIAAVLALVDHQQTAAAATETPVPPVGASPRATAVWYDTLAQVELETVAEWRLLEAIIEVVTQYDRVKGDWEASGAEITAKGSMGQDVEHPALGTLAKLRTQEAALWKQLDLPSSSGRGAARRPGRPTRSEGGGSWGTGVR